MSGSNPNSLQDPLIYYPAITPASGASAFSGLPAATLQQFLIGAQTALHTLLMGQTVAVVSYGEAQGQKSVTYTRADASRLRLHINELQRLLGLAPRRGAMPVIF